MLYWVATRGKGGKDVGMGGANQAAAPVPTIATHQLDAHHKSKGGGPGGDGIPAAGKGGGPGGEDAVHPPFDVAPLIQPGLGVLALLCLCLVVLLLVRCCCRGRRTVELPPDHPYHALPARALTPKKPTKQEEEDFDLFEGAEETGGGGLRSLLGGRPKKPAKQEEEDFDLFEGVGGIR